MVRTLLDFFRKIAYLFAHLFLTVESLLLCRLFRVVASGGCSSICAADFLIAEASLVMEQEP